MSRFRRESLGKSFGYRPGEQPHEPGWLKLNTNESPLLPSAAVGEAVRTAASSLRLYPDPDGEPLRSAIAEHHDVRAEQVFVANGGDQVLDCCYRAFAEPGSAVVHGWPTYSLFPTLSRLFGVHDVAVPLQADGSLPPAFSAEPASLRFVVNPNSPTGAWMAPLHLERMLDAASGVVVIDEAYCDFAPESCIGLLARHESWLVLRTFSKGYALAGLRVGYAVGSVALIDDLRAVQDSYAVDRCALAGAAAALADQAHHRRIVETVIAQRRRLSDGLRGLGWDVPESQANFAFAAPPPPRTAAEVARALRMQRILVRHFAQPGIDDRLRISVGDEDAMETLLRALALATSGAATR